MIRYLYSNSNSSFTTKKGLTYSMLDLKIVMSSKEKI